MGVTKQEVDSLQESLDKSGDIGIAESLVVKLNALGIQCMREGRLKEAERALGQAERLTSDIFNFFHSNPGLRLALRANTFNCMACLERRRPNREAALNHLLDVEQMQLSNPQPALYINICSLLSELDRFEEAISWAQKAIDILSVIDLPTNSDNQMLSVALYLKFVAQHDCNISSEKFQSKDTYEKALEVANTTLGPLHPITISIDNQSLGVKLFDSKSFSIPRSNSNIRESFGTSSDHNISPPPRTPVSERTTSAASSFVSPRRSSSSERPQSCASTINPSPTPVVGLSFLRTMKARPYDKAGLSDPSVMDELDDQLNMELDSIRRQRSKEKVPPNNVRRISVPPLPPRPPNPSPRPNSAATETPHLNNPSSPLPPTYSPLPNLETEDDSELLISQRTPRPNDALLDIPSRPNGPEPTTPLAIQAASLLQTSAFNEPNLDGEPPLQISPECLAALLTNKTHRFVVVDVRDEDFQGGHIVGSQHIPHPLFEKQVAMLASLYVMAEKLIFVCMEGSSYSMIAAHLMRKQLGSEIGSGGPSVYVLAGGFAEFCRLYHSHSELVRDYHQDIWKNSKLDFDDQQVLVSPRIARMECKELADLLEKQPENLLIIDVREATVPSGKISRSVWLPHSAFSEIGAVDLAVQFLQSRTIQVVFVCTDSLLHSPIAAADFQHHLPEGSLCNISVLRGGFSEFARLYHSLNFIDELDLETWQEIWSMKKNLQAKPPAQSNQSPSPKPPESPTRPDLPKIKSCMSSPVTAREKPPNRFVAINGSSENRPLTRTSSVLQRRTSSKLATVSIPQSFQKMHPDKLAAIINSKLTFKTIIVDLRKEDYVKGRIQSSVHIPHDEINIRYTMISDSNADDVVFVCSDSIVHSPGAATYYIERMKKPQNIHVLYGGFNLFQRQFPELIENIPDEDEYMDGISIDSNGSRDYDDDVENAVKLCGNSPRAMSPSPTLPPPPSRSMSLALRRQTLQLVTVIPDTFIRMEASKLADLLWSRDGRTVIIDVRSDNYHGGHIRGSLHIPLNEVSSQFSELIMNPVDNVVFVCMNSDTESPSAATSFLEFLSTCEPPRPTVCILQGGFVNFLRRQREWVECYDSKRWDHLWDPINAARPYPFPAIGNLLSSIQNLPVYRGLFTLSQYLPEAQQFQRLKSVDEENFSPSSSMISHPFSIEETDADFSKYVMAANVIQRRMKIWLAKSRLRKIKEDKEEKYRKQEIEFSITKIQSCFRVQKAKKEAHQLRKPTYPQYLTVEDRVKSAALIKKIESERLAKAALTGDTSTIDSGHLHT